MENLSKEPNISLRIFCFNNILTSAGILHVGKSKPNKKSKLFVTPHVQAKIRTRNFFHRPINQNQQEWIDACRKATEAINKAKAES